MSKFTIFRDEDAWDRWRWFGGWEWTPKTGDQTDFKQYLTKWGARRVARRAMRSKGRS